MAVVPMKRVTIAALRKDRKKIMEFLQRRGVIELQNNIPEDEVFRKYDMSAGRQTFLRNRGRAEQALNVLNTHAPEEKGLLSGLEGRKTITLEEYEKGITERNATQELCSRILDLDKEYAEQSAKIPREELELTALEPWMSFDLPLSFSGTRTTSAFTGTLPGQQTQESIELQFAELEPDLKKDITILSSSPEQTCIFAVCEKEDSARMKDALRRMNFAAAPLSSQVPAEEKKSLEKSIEEAKKRKEKLHEQICELAPRREKIEFLIDYLTMRADKYETIGTLSQSSRVFFVEGYVPARSCEQLEKDLVSRFDMVFEAEDPAADEDVPVLMRNNGYSSPLEPVIESYSLPGKGEFDPSFLTSLFYYAMFGLMLSDAAYGILMAGACAFVLIKFKNMEAGTRKSMKLFLYCGIATIISGFLFGSFFGDAPHVIGETFLGKPDAGLKALWFEPINDPIRMLSFCFLVGLIHLFTGLGAKLYVYIKNGQILDGIYDVVFWFMLVGGAVFYLLSMEMITNMLRLNFIMPAAVGKAAAVIAIIGAVGIVFTGGRESRNWGKRIAKGLYAVYGVTGYLSDLLSYSRLLALGLATSVISSLFNKMGSMFGGGFFGAIMFVIVFLIGHALNIAINALGAYVHTNRLQYVEFFGKFYEGGGRKFRPYQATTKYFKFKEDI